MVVTSTGPTSSARAALHAARCFSAFATCARTAGAAHLQPVSIGRTGRVYTCTTAHHAPEGIEAPFAVGYVDIEEGVRVFAHLTEGVAIGAEVALTAARVRRAPDGGWLTGPRYISR